MTADQRTEPLADHHLDEVEGGRSQGNPDLPVRKDERGPASVYAEGWAGAGATETGFIPSAGSSRMD